MGQPLKPEIFIIAETKICQEGLNNYLTEIDIPEWESDAQDEHSLLTTIAGKLCYKSFDAKLNKNLKKVRNDTQGYIRNIIKVGHGSVFEHSSVTFIFHNVTRVFTHELVRHRVGAAFSQESLRFVALNNLDWYQPNDPDLPELSEYMYTMSEWQSELRKMLINEDMPMSRKKQITSFLRRIAPMGLCTSIMATFNHRTIRHIIKMRTETAAEIEIREVFNQVGHMMKDRYSHMYQDMELNDKGEWVFESPKI